MGCSSSAAVPEQKDEVGSTLSKATTATRSGSLRSENTCDEAYDTPKSILRASCRGMTKEVSFNEVHVFEFSEGAVELSPEDAVRAFLGRLHDGSHILERKVEEKRKRDFGMRITLAL